MKMRRKRRGWMGMAMAAGMAAAGVAIAQGPPPDPARRAELLKKYDKDGDGRLSAEEMDEARRVGEARRSGGRTEKKNEGQEKAPEGEMKNDAAMQRLLERFDADGDGQLDYEEMAALREAMKARRDVQKGGGGHEEG